MRKSGKWNGVRRRGGGWVGGLTYQAKQQAGE